MPEKKNQSKSQIIDELTHRSHGPCIMTIFGAAGDLTKRKLIPALYHLTQSSLLPEGFAVLGFARSEMSTEAFRDHLSQGIKEYCGEGFEDKHWRWLLQRIFYMKGEFNLPDDYRKMAEMLKKLDGQFKTGSNFLFYLATPPSFFGDITQQLEQANLSQEGPHWRRVIIEKPFGQDLETAQKLNQSLRKILKENQIYRIDHYLGKETVQNLLVLRFSNGIFEPIWNHRYVDHVQITVSEELGVENRGGYYEEAGALRDMISNHLLQLYALTAMEPPVSFEADAVRDEKTKALRSLQPIKPEQVLSRVIRGQYGRGENAGKSVVAYRDEKNVSERSTVETFVAMKLLVDSWRWVGVPFYLRTGKRLAKRCTEIAIQFKGAPFMLFRETQVGKLSANLLVIRIQPEEGISLQFGAKIPGPLLRLGDVRMEFQYKDYFGAAPSTGYETLLYDCMGGDATLFQRADTLEASWAVLTSVLDVWKAMPPRSFPNYAAGTWGPAEAQELLESEGRSWRPIP